MKSLKKLGLPTDIPVRVLLGESFNNSLYNLSEDQKSIISILRDVVAEYNRTPVRRKPVTNSRCAAQQMYSRMCDLEHEQVWIVLLNRNYTPVGRVLVGKGGIDFSPIDVRTIISKALSYNATGLILYHNHPSGNPKPSQSDISETEKLKKAAQTVNITLVDHIIICKGRFFSFNDERVIEYK